jgi:hypothetical protein
MSDEESAALELWALPPGSTVELADFQEPVQGNYPQEQTVNVNYSTDPESIKKVKALFDKAAEAALAWENSKSRCVHPVTNSAKIPLPSADELTTISQQQAEAALSFRAEYVEAYEDDVHSSPTPFVRPSWRRSSNAKKAVKKPAVKKAPKKAGCEEDRLQEDRQEVREESRRQEAGQEDGQAQVDAGVLLPLRRVRRQEEENQGRVRGQHPLPLS